MWKLLFIIIVAFAIGKFFYPQLLNFGPVNINNASQTTLENIKKEKTINKFNEAEKINEEANKRALNNQ